MLEPETVLLFNADGVHEIPSTHPKKQVHAQLPITSAWALIDSNHSNLVPPGFLIAAAHYTTVSFLVAASLVPIGGKSGRNTKVHTKFTT
jgi:hypothetical protein